MIVQALENGSNHSRINSQLDFKLALFGSQCVDGGKLDATDFNGVVVVQNYLKRTGREAWARQVSFYQLLFLFLLL